MWLVADKKNQNQSIEKEIGKNREAPVIQPVDSYSTDDDDDDGDDKENVEHGKKRV